MQPRRTRAAGKVSLGTLVFFLVVAAGGYWLWKFFPVHFTSWKVDNILDEGISRAYSLARRSSGDRARGENDLINEMRERIIKLGVDDPQLVVTIEHTGTKAYARAQYLVVIHHPVVDKTTVMTMDRSASTSTAR